MANIINLVRHLISQLTLNTIPINYLKTFVRIAEELVERGRLAELDGVVVEDAIGRQGCAVRLEAAFGQQVFRVQHLRHRDAVTETLIQSGQN